MFCGSCGEKIFESAAFCARCGNLASDKKMTTATTENNEMADGGEEKLSKEVSDLVESYMNQGDFGKKDMEKKYPHIDFKQYVKLKQEVRITKAETDTTHIVKASHDEIMGNLLISGNGKDYVKSVAGHWVTTIIIAVVFAVVGFLLADQFRADLVVRSGAIVRSPIYYMFMWGGIGAAAVILGIGWIHDLYAAKTEIFVHENGIKGAGVGPKFGSSIEDTMTISQFQLEYDRIASVDIGNRNLLFINAFGKVYAVGTANPNEIAEVINNRLRQTKNANITTINPQ